MDGDVQDGDVQKHYTLPRVDTQECAPSDPDVAKYEERHVHILATRGIDCPWASDQTISVVLFGFSLSAFYGLLTPALLPYSWFWALLLVVQCALVALVAISWTLMVTSQPGATPSHVPIAPTKQVTNPYCEYCDAWYTSKRRKHCFRCQRCVHGFDHHCSYLNTCVTDRTYRTFVMLIGSALLLEVLHLAAYIFGSADVQDSSGRTHNFAKEHLGQEVVLAWLIISIAVTFLAVVGLVYLGGFHILLVLRGLSTLEYLNARFPDKITGYAEQQEPPMPGEVEGTVHAEDLDPPPVPDEWKTGGSGTQPLYPHVEPVWSPSNIHLDVFPESFTEHNAGHMTNASFKPSSQPPPPPEYSTEYSDPSVEDEAEVDLDGSSLAGEAQTEADSQVGAQAQLPSTSSGTSHQPGAPEDKSVILESDDSSLARFGQRPSDQADPSAHLPENSTASK